MSEPTNDVPHPQSEEELPPRLLRKLRISIPGFKLDSVIGRGGQAIVLKGIQLSTGKSVAIKLLREGRLADASARERLRREVAALATLVHPNIVGVIDRGVTPDGEDYFVMNYVEGRSLRAFLDERLADGAGHANTPSDDPAALLRLFIKICRAIDFAHQRGIVHRDLCPSNIFIDERGEPQILDFGLARLPMVSQFANYKEKLSVTGQFLGKLAYASPEQARGEPDRINRTTDVYALGVILYEILTGEYPYKVVGNLEEVLRNIIHGRPTPPSKLLAARDAQQLKSGATIHRRHDRAVNQVIDAIVLKALAKRPAERYQFAGELAQDIESYLAGQPTIARLAHWLSPVRPMPTATRAGRYFNFVAGALVLCAMGWGLVFSVGDNQVPSEPTTSLAESDDAVSPDAKGQGEKRSAPRDGEVPKPADALQVGSFWFARGRYGGALSLTVINRDGENFAGRLTLPGQRGGDFFVEGTIRGKEVRWRSRGHSLADFAGTIEGDELATQPIHYYETRGPVTFRREK